MTTTKNAANVTKAEEAKAAFEEGAAKITLSALKEVQRVHELKAIMAPMVAEIKAIQEKVLAEMVRKHVNKLTHNGVVVVENIITHPTKIDTTGLFTDYPELQAIYVTKTDGTRFDWKKPVV